MEVEVQDTGIGMDEATQARIFDPFFTTKDLGGGSGLGLASVYGILKNHRGLIRVQSQVGQGSTFICALPRSKASVVAREKRRLKGTHQGEGTVLVVDDQEIIRTVSKAMLEMIGYAVLKAESGEEGLAIFQEHRDKIKTGVVGHDHAWHERKGDLPSPPGHGPAHSRHPGQRLQHGR